MPALPRYYAGGQPGGWNDGPQESGGDSKAFYAKKNFCDGRTSDAGHRTDGQTDVTMEIVM